VIAADFTTIRDVGSKIVTATAPGKPCKGFLSPDTDEDAGAGLFNERLMTTCGLAVSSSSSLDRKQQDLSLCFKGLHRLPSSWVRPSADGLTLVAKCLADRVQLSCLDEICQ